VVVAVGLLLKLEDLVDLVVVRVLRVVVQEVVILLLNPLQ
tara:strand:+ start:146 stop:265 length:120 start_codon:yes stop_codon:yes gene_type:complete